MILKMKKINKKLDGVIEIIPEPHKDSRGFLVRCYDKKIFKGFGINTKWVQESHSHTYKKYTLRGLHVSLPPHLEAKLIRAIKGEVLWVVVDLRKDSPTFGKYHPIILSDKLKNLLYVKRGFAHGCISLTDNCDLIVKSDNYYSPKIGTGIKWDDPELDIDWNLNGESPYLISERDKNYPTFKKFKEKYGGFNAE